MNEQATAQSDALVIFGATGDLAFKKIFPALQAMSRRGNLKMPVIGVGRSKWSDEHFKERVQASLQEHGKYNAADFAKLASHLRFVSGDYGDKATYQLLREALGTAKSPLYYVALPPSIFTTVANELAAMNCNKAARIVIEKPFGHDLESAKQLNKTLLAHFPERAIFRVDHYLGKEPVQNLVYFRFANPMIEAGWSGEFIESVQITMAENFDVAGRGKFYEETGAIRDVLQNHMLQLIACLAMEAPSKSGEDALRDARGAALQKIRPLTSADIVRGQFRGYRSEDGVAADSKVETYVAARFFIDHERWKGVPFYVRTGKCLPVTATEIVVRFKCAHHSLLADCAQPLCNYYRFQISPEVLLAIGAKVKKAGDQLAGETIELLAHHQAPDEMDPYERLLGDAAKGDAALFARQDSVESSWRVIDPVLDSKDEPVIYDKGTWGPAEMTTRLAPEGGWADPKPRPKGKPA